MRWWQPPVEKGGRGILQLQSSHQLIVRYYLQDRDNLWSLNVSRLENGHDMTGMFPCAGPAITSPLCCLHRSWCWLP